MNSELILVCVDFSNDCKELDVRVDVRVFYLSFLSLSSKSLELIASKNVENSRETEKRKLQPAN